MLLANLLNFVCGFYGYISLSQNAIEDKLDKNQWPFISNPPINTTQSTTAVRWVLETDSHFVRVHNVYKRNKQQLVYQTD